MKVKGHAKTIIENMMKGRKKGSVVLPFCYLKETSYEIRQ